MNHSQINIVITGDYRQAEFAGVFDTSEALVTFVEWPKLLSEPADSIDFIFIAQTRRGQWSQESVFELVRKFPLAQKAIVVGAWCEGETRSGRPLDGIHRIYLRDWPPGYRDLIAQFYDTGTTWLSHPVTENRADFLINHPSRIESTGPLNIAIHAMTPDSFDTLAEFCRVRGWDTTRFDPSSKGPSTKCDLAIIECGYRVDEAIQVTESLNARIPVIAICGFPRHQDRDKLQMQFPRFELFGKPFDNVLLEKAIRRLMQNGGLKIVSDVA